MPSMVREDPANDDDTELLVLVESLKKSDALSSKITKSLNILQSSAIAVESSMQPIFDATKSLSTMSKNIDATIIAIRKTTQYDEVLALEEPIIKTGPEATSVAAYASSLMRLFDAIDSLQMAAFPNAKESRTRMIQVLDYGSAQLEEEFKFHLLKLSQPIEPLQYITKSLPFPVYSESDLQLLKSYFTILPSKAGDNVISKVHNAVLDAYINIRAERVASSLSTLAQGTLSTTHRRSSVPYDRGSNGFSTYCQALTGLLNAEIANSEILATKELTNLLPEISKPAVKKFIKVVQDVCDYIGQNLLSECFLAFEMVEDLAYSMNLLESIIDAEGREQLRQSLARLKSLGTSSFPELIEDVRRKGAAIHSLISDTGVLAIIPDTMSRLRRMADYQRTVSDLLSTSGRGGWHASTKATSTSSSAPRDADGMTLLSDFCTDWLDTLLLVVEGKARNLNKRGPASIAILILNNCGYIQTIINRSNLENLIGTVGMTKVEKVRNRAVDQFLEPWKLLSQQLLDVTYTQNKSGRTSMSGKEKDVIKDKFKKFNSEFDSLVEHQRSFAIPDREIRELLLSEITRVVLPLYQRFYDKYANSDFAKNTSKYVKYNKLQLSEILNSLST